MNHRMVFNIIGKIILIEAALFLLPAGVSAAYGEKNALVSFLITALFATIIGAVINLVSKPKNNVIFAKEGFIIVALAWISVSVIGAIPFVISGEIPNFINALFETVSGFTTTGASILTNVEGLGKGMLFWRSFTHWIGGMGVLVFIMALMPNISDRTIHIMRAEMPGPIVGKLLPRVKDTAKTLYLIYIVMTVIEAVFLICGGMSVFESFVHSFGTAGTGGFGTKSNSIEGYSPYIQWVIAIFMLLFGINFNLYYLILIKKARLIFKSGELWTYLAIVVVSVTAITANILPICNSLGEALRLSAFQTSSIITTTGFATADFNLWPSFSRAIIFILMFIGGCAGSTAGGLKISRVILLFKIIRREMKRLLHPRTVSPIKLEGKPIDDNVISGTSAYFAIYVLCIAAVFLILCLEPFGMETNLSAAVSCFNNVGPGFALVGPTGNYDCYSDLSTLVLTFAMMLGRLEIFPLIIALLPKAWSPKK